MPRSVSLLLLPAVLAWASPGAASAVEIDWVTVGDPGNACDAQRRTCHGGVDRAYRIARTETTNAQYAAFLNAVGATDTHGLYAEEAGGPHGGIARSGAPGSYRYAAVPGRERRPVDFVSFWDALRFANWLHNGQPAGAQDASTTEDGAYTLTPTALESGEVVRNAGARVFLPSEDEWYKAAYYDAEARRYFDYPTGSDTVPRCAPPGPTAANTANCAKAVGDLTDVGSYPASASPSGTFDQGGNAFEWNEARVGPAARNLRGGAFHRGAVDLRAATRHHHFAPSAARRGIGFRVAARETDQADQAE